MTSTLSGIKAVLRELKSGNGSYTSSTRPYKILTGVSFITAWYDNEERDMVARINFTADHQSPYGDNWDSNKNFILSRAWIKSLARREGEFRQSFDEIAGKTDARYPAARAEFDEECAEAARDSARSETPLPRARPICFN